MTPTTPPDWNGPISRGRAVNRIIVVGFDCAVRNEISTAGLPTTKYGGAVCKYNDDLHKIIDDMISVHDGSVERRRM